MRKAKTVGGKKTPKTRRWGKPKLHQLKTTQTAGSTPEGSDFMTGSS